MGCGLPVLPSVHNNIPAPECGSNLQLYRETSYTGTTIKLADSVGNSLADCVIECQGLDTCNSFAFSAQDGTTFYCGLYNTQYPIDATQLQGPAPLDIYFITATCPLPTLP
jgi:hypothetical protein